MIDKLIKETRSFRSFSQDKLTLEDLENIIEVARYSGSARNAQPIRYVLINDAKICNEVFSKTNWAGALKWNPSISDSPTSYILMVNDKNIGTSEPYFYFDMGIASQNIMLKLRDMKFGGCLIGSYNKVEVRKILDISDDYELGVLIAIGKPAEKVEVVDTEKNTTYYRKDNIHYVPKLTKEKLIIKKV